MTLPTIPRRRVLQGAAAIAGAGAVTSVLPARAHALPAGASQFVPLAEPIRVLDTREPHKYEFTRHLDNHVTIPLVNRYGIPANASAVVATATAVNLMGGNWVTVVPTGVSVPDLAAQNKLASILNLAYFGEATANLCQIKIANGGVDMFSLGPCHMVFDVIGYYAPTASAVRAGRFVPLASAQRAIDTRDSFGHVGAGQTLVVDVTAWVPAHASSVMVNLTATETVGAGFLTAYPFDSPSLPATSSLNVNSPGATRAAAVIVAVRTQSDGRRYIKVFTLDAVKMIVDVMGYFTGSTSTLSTDGLFVPEDPVRILDTRDPGQIGRLWPGWTIEGLVPGGGGVEGAAAVVNLTGVASRSAGFLTISPARVPMPATSNLNFSGAFQIIPNQAVTPITAGAGYQVFASHGAHVLVDYMGYYTGTQSIPRIAKPDNPPPPPIGPWWTLSIPSIGLVSSVRGGNSNSVTNSGHSWHWTGTGFMGQHANVAMFAHRTSAGGPYRYLHLLEAGDLVYITTGDFREFTYQVVRRDLTDANTQHILDATRFHTGTTLSLIACTRPDFTPTNLNWRIIVTAELIGWRELI